MISRYRMALMQVVDLCCILLALAVSGMVTIAPDLSVFDDYTGASLFTIFFYLLFFYILDAYSVGMEDFKDTLGRILVACVLGIISSATASFALENWRFDRVTVLLLFALSFVFCLGWRFLYYLNADKLTHPLRVLLVGVDRGGKVRKLLAEGLPKARILGYVGEKDQDPDAGECFGPPFMALEAAKKHGATMIVLLPDAPIDDDIAHDLLEAKLHGAMVVDIRTFYEHVVQRLPLSQITEEWLLQTEGFSLNTRGSLRRLKRAFDLFLSLMLLIPAAPIMLITALLIRLESPGPVIYRQDRVGLYEKEFTVYKFRSMRTDAEKNGAVWAAANDARVTRVGKFIRKVRIDELPQIWNIIKGDMSFIGPRPERMTFVKQLKEHIPYYSLRHTVKPGLTGWAQVNGRDCLSDEEKAEYDREDIERRSLLFDTKIFFRTIWVVLTGKDVVEGGMNHKEEKEAAYCGFICRWRFFTLCKGNADDSINPDEQVPIAAPIADSRKGCPYEVRCLKIVQTSRADNNPYCALFHYSLLLITLSEAKQTPQSRLCRAGSPAGEPKSRRTKFAHTVCRTSFSEDFMPPAR